MDHAHILTIGTARSGLNPDSDVGVGGLILKLTEFFREIFLLALSLWRSRNFTCYLFDVSLVNVTLD